MPFYTRRMARFLAGMEGKSLSTSSHRTQKKAASNLGNGSESNVSEMTLQGSMSGVSVGSRISGLSRDGQGSKSSSKIASQTGADEPPPSKDDKVDDFDAKRIKMMRGILKSEVQRIRKAQGPEEWTDKTSQKYKMNTSGVVVFGKVPYMHILKASMTSYPDTQVVAKIYNFGEECEGKKDSLEWKIVRHIGKKHPYIERTFDIFIHQQKIIVFQDLADRGSMKQYLAEKGPQSEQQVGKWAWQLANALDYLGNIGVAHRGIKPSHLLLSSRDLILRLTGFHHSFLYFDDQTGEVMNIPCLSMQNIRTRDKPDFQAPEVYGDEEKEEFDPLAADVWSFGSVLFNALTLQYPYKFDCTNEEFVASLDQIEPSVKNATFSQEAKQFIGNCLRLNVDERLIINQLFTNEWCKKKK